MKGIIKLAPIDNPVVGMKVILYKSIQEIEYVGNGKYDDKGQIYLKGFDGEDWFGQKELQQLVVEYNNSPPAAQFYASGIKPSKGVSILPLHPDDWEKGIELIGEEVEFRWHNKKNRMGKIISTPCAILTTPSPILYTEDEAKNLASRAFRKDTRLDFDNWWEINKKK